MNLPTYITGTIQTKSYAILRENVYVVLDKRDITPTYWAMLGVIFEAKDGIRQAAVAKAMNVKPPLITIMVRQMEQRGIIQTVQNQFDARAKLLSVTPEGKRFMKDTESELNKQLTMLLVGLTESDMRTYQKVLLTIISNGSSL